MSERLTADRWRCTSLVLVLNRPALAPDVGFSLYRRFNHPVVSAHVFLELRFEPRRDSCDFVGRRGLRLGDHPGHHFAAEPFPDRTARKKPVVLFRIVRGRLVDLPEVDRRPQQRLAAREHLRENALGFWRAGSGCSRLARIPIIPWVAEQCRVVACVPATRLPAVRPATRPRRERRSTTRCVPKRLPGGTAVPPACPPGNWSPRG